MTERKINRGSEIRTKGKSMGRERSGESADPSDRLSSQLGGLKAGVFGRRYPKRSPAFDGICGRLSRRPLRAIADVGALPCSSRAASRLCWRASRSWGWHRHRREGRFGQLAHLRHAQRALPRVHGRELRHVHAGVAVLSRAGANRPSSPGVPLGGLVADSHLGVLRRVH